MYLCIKCIHNINTHINIKNVATGYIGFRYFCKTTHFITNNICEMFSQNFIKSNCTLSVFDYFGESS